MQRKSKSTSSSRHKAKKGGDTSVVSVVEEKTKPSQVHRVYPNYSRNRAEFDRMIRENIPVVTIVGQSVMGPLLALEVQRRMTTNAVKLSLVMLPANPRTVSPNAVLVLDEARYVELLAMDAAPSETTLRESCLRIGLTCLPATSATVLSTMRDQSALLEVPEKVYRADLLARCQKQQKRSPNNNNNNAMLVFEQEKLSTRDMEYFTVAHPTTAHLIFTEPLLDSEPVWRGAPLNISKNPEWKEQRLYWLEWTCRTTSTVAPPVTNPVPSVGMQRRLSIQPSPSTNQEFTFQYQLNDTQYNEMVLKLAGSGMDNDIDDTNDNQTEPETKTGGTLMVTALSNIAPELMDFIREIQSEFFGADNTVVAMDSIRLLDEQVDAYAQLVQVVGGAVVYLFGDASVSSHAFTGGDIFSLMAPMREFAQWLQQNPHPLTSDKLTATPGAYNRLVPVADLLARYQQSVMQDAKKIKVNRQWEETCDEWLARLSAAQQRELMRIFQTKKNNGPTSLCALLHPELRNQLVANANDPVAWNSLLRVIGSSDLSAAGVFAPPLLVMGISNPPPAPLVAVAAESIEDTKTNDQLVLLANDSEPATASTVATIAAVPETTTVSTVVPNPIQERLRELESKTAQLIAQIGVERGYLQDTSVNTTAPWEERVIAYGTLKDRVRTLRQQAQGLPDVWASLAEENNRLKRTGGTQRTKAKNQALKWQAEYVKLKKKQKHKRHGGEGELVVVTPLTGNTTTTTSDEMVMVKEKRNQNAETYRYYKRMLEQTTENTAELKRAFEQLEVLDQQLMEMKQLLDAQRAMLILATPGCTSAACYTFENTPPSQRAAFVDSLKDQEGDTDYRFLWLRTRLDPQLLK